MENKTCHCSLCGEEINPEEAYEINVQIRKQINPKTEDRYNGYCVCPRCKDLFIRYNFGTVSGLRAVVTDDFS